MEFGKENPEDKISNLKTYCMVDEKYDTKRISSNNKNAVLAWNEAFESAGFKNAVECYEQPDSATLKPRIFGITCCAGCRLHIHRMAATDQVL